MSTDLLNHITGPADLGQPTYTELIYTVTRQGKAFPPATATVANSLAHLAFGAPGPYQDITPQTAPTISAIPARAKARQYSLTNLSPQSLKPNLNNEFLALASGPIPPNCLGIGQSGATLCPNSPCPFDLIILLDDTNSMAATITNLKSSLLQLFKLIDQLTTGSYRLGLATFKDTVIPRVTLTANVCGSASASVVQAALLPVNASGGNNPPEASDLALTAALNGDLGLWRNDALRLVLLITDSYPGGSSDVFVPGANDVNAHQLALQAAACGIKILAANVGQGVITPGVRTIMQDYASTSMGFYLETSTGAGLTELLTSYLTGLCSSTESAFCAGPNLVINGGFDTDINGWLTSGTVNWVPVGGKMQIGNGSAITQIIPNLTAGNRIRLGFTCTTLLLSTVTAGFDAATTSQLIPAGTTLSVEREFTISNTGAVTLSIACDAAGTIIIDNVIVCELVIEDCGVGSRNLINNSNFEDGILGWTDLDNNQLPATDPAYWDASVDALIIDLTHAAARYRLTNLSPNQNLVLSFELYSHDPDNPTNELVYALVDSTNTPLLTGSILNSGTVFPLRVVAPLTLAANSDGLIYVQFQAGATSGVIKLRNILCCDVGGLCPTGQTRVAFDQFQNSRGGWAGGTLTNGAIVLATPGSGNDTLRQVFTELTPGTQISLTGNCLTAGGIIIEFYAGTTIDQFFSDLLPGIKTFQTTVQADGIVTILIKAQTSAVTIDDILICQSLSTSCETGISEVRSLITWTGIPRQPTNIFNLILRCTYRDPLDPFKLSTVDLLATSDGRLGATVPSNCADGSTCDFWKQQGDGNTIQTNITSTGLNVTASIQSGQYASVTRATNWLWSIPANYLSSAQDSLFSIWPDPPVGLIESLQFLILVNTISWSKAKKTCPEVFSLGPDPASAFDFVVRYKNSQGRQREFRQTFALSTLYQIIIIPTPVGPLSVNSWDTLSALGNGITGTSARWEAALFVLDAVDGSGLDQCSIPLKFSTTGRGQLVLGGPYFQAEALVTAPCVPTVTIEEITKGQAINEIQSITIPKSTQGTWALEFTGSGSTISTAPIPFNTASAGVQAALTALTNIGVGNVRVRGAGTVLNPFLVEFIGLLAGAPQHMLVADGSLLKASTSALVTKLINGTTNERQLIHEDPTIAGDLIVSFASIPSVPILSDASLNQMQTALSNILSIGVGNVSVLGQIADRDAAYQGPWFVDFVGTFSGQPVPALVAQTPGYTISTSWQGGVGVNDLQEISVTALGGTFTLTIPKFTGGGAVITAPISITAGAAAVSAAITQVATWLAGNIKVTAIAQTDPQLHVWDVEFIATYQGKSMPLLTANGSALVGSTILVKEVTKGFGVSEVQQVSIVLGRKGTFQLTVPIGPPGTTNDLSWNITAAELQAALLATSSAFSQTVDITVELARSSDPDITASFMVTFNQRFGAVNLMVLSENQLVCSPMVLHMVPPPPYNYQLPDCIDTESPFCTPGPLVCRPEAEAAGAVLEPCAIRDSANVYREIVLERDLFNPNTKTSAGGTLTIRDLAVLKGLKPALYTAYLRDYISGGLTLVDITTPIRTKMSVLLIETAVDSVPTRARLSRQLQTRPNVLPTRMVWGTADVLQ